MNETAPAVCEPESNELWNELPAHLRPGLRRYLEEKIVPGSFLMYCLANDFRGAVAQAAEDLELWDLRCIAKFLFLAVPSEAWGSMEKVKEWSKKR